MKKRLDPYNILGVKRTSTDVEITRAYRRLQRIYHPDSRTGDREMYEEVRRAYEEICKSPAVEIVPVEDVRRMYKGSEEEAKDIAGLYNRHRGRMGRILDGLLLSDDGDEDRVREIIDRLIGCGALKQYSSYGKRVSEDKARGRRKAREERMAKKIAGEMGIDLDVPLEDLLGRRKGRDAKFLESLEEKYLGGCREEER
ncbi:similarity to DnaJ family [Encephalitozoon cuniculi GB-M1]|uniref:Similarity to DnaJ family n=2 Tax=Encephalitozoon cuniculi TaxID=6035 RepID=Q8SV09_ENCCU|nr:type II HSP40 co-chaperone SIS1 [Encephalitozoon cuniculi GB-M1]AGE95868.1 dnaj family [Encephalitozoon cuniculi]KMV65802.1 DnaJ domain-containing protein [Encephalitozoon cuniculi EcunIII-L]UYI27236.1 DnaJ domain-containing protein [Encephalitozoon cuniculi]CAD25610.1 similarity to DnaJ family [Encephalitozoon cuniculi GB-M1]